ncbi:MAG: cysteine desulfurase family protein [bacterium]
MARLFLDHNATTPLKPAVKEAMIAAMEAGNPSSVHSEGRHAKALLETARAQLARRFDADTSGIIFTSGGTEAINMALWGMVRRETNPVTHLFISAIEHDAMLNCANALEQAGFVRVEIIPACANGQVDLSWLDRRLQKYDVEQEGAFLASIMLANNENGVIQDIASIRSTIFQKGGFLFVDAIQAAGKIPVSFNDQQTDLMAVSGHKIAGPKGIGALITKPGIPLAPLLQGGGQELRRRVGTENIIGIVGFGAAAEQINLDQMAQLSAMRDDIAAGLKQASITGLRIWGEDSERLPNTICFSAPGFASETQVMALDLEGIAVSAGSACSSGKVKASHVITALGARPEEASSTLRVSLGWNSPPDTATLFLEKWLEAYQRATKRIVA